MKTQGIRHAATAAIGRGDESEAPNAQGRRCGRGRGRARRHGQGTGHGHERHGCDGARDGAARLGSATPKPAPKATNAEPSTAATLTIAPKAPTEQATPIETTATAVGGGTDLGSQLVQQVAAQLDGSEVARQVLSMVARGGAAVDVLDDATFERRHGRAYGVYDPATKRIQIPRSLTSDPEQLRIVLLHEGVHWVQDNTPGGIAAAGGAIARALEGAAALRQVDRSTKAGMQHDEAQAFLLEAIAAQQAGVADPGLATVGGRVLPYGQVVAAVRSIPEYR